MSGTRPRRKRRSDAVRIDSRRAGELKLVQRLCRLLVAGGPAEKPGVANSLLKQIRDARVAGATSAPDLAVVALQWCL